VNVKKIMLGVSGVVAAFALAACSSGTSASGAPQLAAAASSMSASTSAKPVPTTVPTTTAPTTTTTVAPPPVTTTKPPVPATTKPPVQQASVAPGIPCTVVVTACVSISEQKAWLVSDGKVIAGPVTVKTGRPSYPTPVGTFHVLYHDKNHVSKAFNDAPMPYSTFFTTDGVAFHEGSLSVSSHGCVHMSRSNAILWFNTLQVGDTVQVVR
jgi:lipoprotein-anchoring transpeptidase ErfK/SrfK